MGSVHISFFLFTFVSCNYKINLLNFDYSQQSNDSGPRSIFTENGIYFFVDDNIYYYENDKIVSLGYLSYINGTQKKVRSSDGSIKLGEYNTFQTKYLDDIYYINSRFYYISKYSDINDNTKYFLSSIDNKGENLINHCEIKEDVNKFYITKQGFIYSYIANEGIKYKKIDSKFNQEELDLDIKVDFFIVNNLVIYNEILENGNNNIVIYDIENKIEKVIENKGFINSVSNKYFSTSEIDTDNNKSVSYIFELDNLEEVIRLDDEVIWTLNDKYFISSRVYGEQNYKKYDFTGNILKEILPKDLISSDIQRDSIFNMKYLGIINSNDRYGVYKANKSDTHNYIVDFERDKIVKINFE